MDTILKEKAERTVAKLREMGLTFATAESCTGGLTAKLVTDIPGSSEVFCGGIVSYSNSVKQNVLGVSSETLKRHGAVSENTAREMSEGALKICKAGLAVSTTGIAGPGGGSPEKPVGTVCFAISSQNGTESFTKRFESTLSRDEIRRASSAFALDLLYKKACEE